MTYRVVAVNGWQDTFAAASGSCSRAAQRRRRRLLEEQPDLVIPEKLRPRGGWWSKARELLPRKPGEGTEDSGDTEDDCRRKAALYALVFFADG